MSCYRPLLGHRTGVTENGKPKYNLVSYTDGVLDVLPHEELIQIPCGKCIGCRLDYAKRWTDRILMESKMYKENYFITLTYDDDHVPTVEYNGIKIDTLLKKDVQDFFKRLRDRVYPDKIRYYLCGEYGDKLRPHYHVIVFNLHLPDVTAKTGARSSNGDPILESQILNKIWGKGFAELGTVTEASAGYVARYVLKKVQNDQKDVQEAYGMQPEFVTMSRRPAIGRPYFDAHPEMFRLGKAYLATEKGSVMVKPDRYFKALTETQQDKITNYVKSKIIRKDKEDITELPYSEILKNEEINKKAQTSLLNQRK